MKFVLAFAAAAAALKLTTKTKRANRHTVQVRNGQDMEMPDWLSEDPECQIYQGLAWASYQLTDADNNGHVTLDEMNNTMEDIMSATPSDVEEIYYAIAGIDGNASYISEDDLWAACPYMIEEGFAEEDCWAVGILLYIADLTLGDADGEYELNEVQAGVAVAQEFVGECEMGTAEAMDMVDLNGDGSFSYAEFEEIMPFMCDYI